MSNNDYEFTGNNISGALEDELLGEIYGRLTLDANGDNTESNGSGGWDAGVAGVTVKLLDAAGNLVAETTTNAYGSYRFEVPAGQYVVQFSQVTGHQYAETDIGANAAADSDAGADGRTAIIDLQAGQIYANIDASLQKIADSDELTYTNTSSKGCIRGRLSLDANGDNTESNGSGGSDAGITGQTVQLLDIHGNVVATTTTGTNGTYRFDVWPGDYVVKFSGLDGYEFSEFDRGGNAATDSDAFATGLTRVIHLGAGQAYADIDASLQKVASGDELTYTNTSSKGCIRGRLSLDANGDNTESNGSGGSDAGLTGITVQLLDVHGNIVASGVTGTNGTYRFDVWPGDYVVKFAGIDGYAFSEIDRGGNAATDSDVFVNGMTRVIHLGAGQVYADIDASVVKHAAAESHEYNQVIASRALINSLFANGSASINASDLGSMNVIDDDVTLEDNNNATNGTMQTLDVSMQTLATDFVDINTGARISAGSYVMSRGYFDVQVDDGAGNITTAKLYQIRVITEGTFDGKAVPEYRFPIAEYYAFSNDVDITGNAKVTLISGIRAEGNVAHENLFSSSERTYSAITDADPELLVRTLGAELIVNGGFETHTNTGKTGYWMYNDGGVKGWTAAGMGTKIELHTGNYGTGNTVGNAIVELDATKGVAEGVKQTFTVKEAGTYQVSFDYGMRAFDAGNEPWWYDSATNAMIVLVDGQLVQVAGSGSDSGFDRGFQHRTFDLNLSAGQHTITFLEDGYDRARTDDGGGAELDNVSVRQVKMVLDTGNVAGTVFYDGDQDGVHDAGEGGLGGLTVYLLRGDQSFVKDADGNYVTTTTGSDGSYTFEGVKPGSYRVGVVGREGGDGAVELNVPKINAMSPFGEKMFMTNATAVKAGIETGGIDAGMFGATGTTTIEVCENETFVRDFDTACNIISEDVYFMVGEPVCARIGRTSFDESQTQSWNNSTTTAVPYYVFLEEAADTDLTFTIKLTVDPDKVAIGNSGYAPGGFAYLTDQANEINAPRYEEVEVTVKAGQTKSEAFFVGTEAARLNYVFGIEIDNIYNHDLNEMCERVQRVATTPVAIDLNRDGHIGVTGATTSSDKSGLTIGETVHFDMNADGKAERIEWFDGSGDGILIDNRDGGAFSDMDGSRLFGDDNGRYADGYEKLRALFDANGDGKISGAELNGLMLWVDDGDAKVEAGELQTLKSHSITEISGRITTTTDASGRELIRSTVKQNFEATGNVTYSLEGPDAALFTVDKNGQVKFKAAPDYENPLDQGADNVYNVTLVRVTGDPTCAPARENLRIEICDKPSLGDTVWYDTNKNGVLDNGESGAKGVTVKLIDAATNAVVATMLTDANGKYLFDDLNPGNYKVMFVAPSGYTFTTQSTAAGPEAANNDSDANVANGMTDTIFLSEGEHQRNVDAGLVVVDPGTASLGDTVWYDTNKNGVLDNGESGAKGVTVKLINPVNGAVLATTTTDANGNYLFDNLDAGDYQVMFVSPNGYQFTTKSTVNADVVNNDSDAGVNGMTGTVTLSIGEAERDVDAGLVVVNHAPSAVNDAGKICVGEDKVLDVLANDSDPDGNPLTISAVGGQSIAEGQSVTLSDGVIVTLTGGDLVFDSSSSNYTSLLIGEKASATYSYQISDGEGGVASANIDMSYCGSLNTLATIAASLPETGVMNLSIDGTGGDFYTALISGTNDARFDGKTFDIVFCGAAELPINMGVDVPVNIHLATEDDAPASIVNEQNLDMVNWILNQDFTSMDNGDGNGKNYTEAEIQGAIWGLTDDFVFVNENVPAFGTTANAQEIYDLAIANGEGFEAGEGDIIGLILDPTADAIAAGNKQPMIIGIEWDDLAQDCFCL